MARSRNASPAAPESDPLTVANAHAVGLAGANPDDGRPAARIEAAIAAAAMGTIVAITMANVIVRYFTDESFAWTEEISVFLLLVVTLAGSAVAAARDRHIRMSYFYDTGSAARRSALFRLSSLACLLLFAGMTVLLARVGYDEFVHGETTMVLGLPRWWYTGLLALLAAAVAVRVAAWALRREREDAAARTGAAPR